MQYDEPTVRREDHRLYVRDYPGSEPAIILMHGFGQPPPVRPRRPLLAEGRRVVTFDFLGWGRSDKPAGYAYTASNQTGDLDAVLDLQLGSVVLVAHDASGPPAIDWALDHPERVSALVLLNTYYCRMSGVAPTGGDLAVLHPGRPLGRRTGLDVVRRAGVSPPVPVAGEPVLPGRGGPCSVCAPPV